METLGKFFTGIILLIVGIMITGFVVMKFWGWFIVTTITMTAPGPMGMNVDIAINPLTFAQAIGLSMFFTLLSKRPDSRPDDTFADVVERWLVNAAYIGIIFFIGWIIHTIIF